MQYEPNAIARSLASKKTGNIGVIIPHEAGYYLSNNYWPILLSVITKVAARAGYAVILSTSQKEGDVESAFKLMLNGKRIDGIITGSEMLEEKQVSELVDREIPFVMVGKSPMIDGYYVDIDNRGGMYSLTNHVIKQGYKKLLFICGPEYYNNVQERVLGFHDAVAKKDNILWKVVHTHYEQPDVKNIIANCIDSGFKPDAVLAGAGDLFISTYSALKTLNLSIPANVGFASFDKLRFYDFFNPKITAIKQPIEELGEASFDILFKLMSSRQPESKSRRFTCTLEIGESCGERN